MQTEWIDLERTTRETEAGKVGLSQTPLFFLSVLKVLNVSTNFFSKVTFNSTSRKKQRPQSKH